MNNKLSKIGLLLIALINCSYVYILIRGLMNPNPVTNESVYEGSQSVIVIVILFALLCITGLFVKEKHIGIYRKCSEILAVIRLVAGEFGAFWFSFYLVWHDDGFTNPSAVLMEIDKLVLIMVTGIILLLFTLPVMTHIAALMCFEYGLSKEKRMKNLRIYKIILICLSVIALISIPAMLILNFQMTY